ncbi:MAG: acyl-CoA thioesterase, partial [Burkholderiaceae bacterium]|nr:acyl-CoA thioesterase [Burkholderiaceae bacterium]
PWHETEKTLGVFGTPLVDTHSKFLKTASYGDTLLVNVSVTEWRDKSFVQVYRIMRGDEAIMECEEVRIFAARRTDGKNGIRAVAIPPEIQALCS